MKRAISLFYTKIGKDEMGAFAKSLAGVVERQRDALDRCADILAYKLKRYDEIAEKAP